LLPRRDSEMGTYIAPATKAIRQGSLGVPRRGES
jgi:hypothetical protein